MIPAAMSWEIPRRTVVSQTWATLAAPRADILNWQLL
jgi:hypothetical protein